VNELLIAFGLVAVIEGLVLALAPSRVTDMLKLLMDMSIDQRRSLGVICVAIGVGIVWLVKIFSA